jgi:hypothetical protein
VLPSPPVFPPTTSYTYTEPPYTHTESLYTHTESPYTYTKPLYTHTEPPYTYTKPLYTHTEPPYTYTKPSYSKVAWRFVPFAHIVEVELYQSRRRSLQLPPFCRFPPLREGNPAKRLRW